MTNDIGDNSFDAEKLGQYVEEIEKEQAEIDAIMEEAKRKTQPNKERIKEYKKDAHNDGFGRKPLNLALADRRTERRRQAKVAKLNDDQKTEYELMTESLGELADTPLGGAALQAAQ